MRTLFLSEARVIHSAPKANLGQRPMDIFVYGTLRDPEVLSCVLGPERSAVTVLDAVLPDHVVRVALDGPYPGLDRLAGNVAEGSLLVNVTEAGVDRLAAFEAAFAFDLLDMDVEAGGVARTAKVFIPHDTVPLSDRVWRLETWRQTGKALFLSMAQDLMQGYGTPDWSGSPRQRVGALRRALARLRAGEMARPKLGTDFGAEGIQDLARERAHYGFFALDLFRYRHRRFGGGYSDLVEREVFLTGDAVTVLPWDPKRDRILMIEQVRAGLIGRGDRNPWSLEVIAGLVDCDETPEDTARREAEEEAGLSLGRMVELGSYYSSPGACSEYLTGFVAEAELDGNGGLGGLASEHEDIRSLVLTFDEAMAALARGDVRNAPAIIALQGLAARREALAVEWGYKLAAPNAQD